MERQGSAGSIAAVLLVVIMIPVIGMLIYYDSRGNVSNAFSVLTDGLKFASGGGIAQIQAGGTGLVADTFTGDGPRAPTCGTAPRNSYIQLINTGTVSGTATTVTITSGGASSNFAIAGSCKIGPSGSITASMYILFRGPNKLASSATPEAGQKYVGTVTLSSGAQLLFAGNFNKGYPQVSIMGLALSASDFTQGKPVGSTCSATPSPENAYLMLNNTGTVGTSVTSVTITWKNATNAFPINGSCNIGADGTPSAITYILFGASNKMSVAAEAGQPFTGTVTLSTGAQIPFSSRFQ